MSGSVAVLVVILLLLAFNHYGFASNNSFTMSPEVRDGECIRVGETVSFECVTVDQMGVASTVWRGSAFNCPSVITAANNRITLPHSDYVNPGGASGMCGQLMAQSGTVDGDCYPSTLMFTATIDLDNTAVECSISGVIEIGTDNLRIGVPPDPAMIPTPSTAVFSSSGTEFTISWLPPSNASMVVGTLSYTVTREPCGPPNTTTETSITFLTPPNGQFCSFEVTGNDNCSNFNSSAPLVIDITFDVPDQPNISDIDVIVDQSDGTATVEVTWDVVSATNFSVSSGGANIFNGSITGYTSLVNGEERMESCNDSFCNLRAPFTGREVDISISANNALGSSPPQNANVETFEVTRDPNPNPTNVILQCGAAQCTLRYGVSGTELTMTGQPGVALEGLAENMLYMYEATVQLDNITTVTVTDTFGTCECSESLLGTADSEADAECRAMEYVGGVRLNNGIVCYTGTTEGSQAFFICRNGGTVSLNITVECQCQTAGSSGEWGIGLENAKCPTSGLSTGAIIAIIIVVLAVLELLVAAVVLVIACIKRKNEDELSLSTRIWFALGIALLFIFIGIVIALGILIFFLFCCRERSDKKEKLKNEDHELQQHDPNSLYSDPKAIPHENAPASTDVYALPDKNTKKPKPQEPSKLEKEAGPDGDLYTVATKPKRGSSKKKDPPQPTEEQLAEMYATPDLAKKNRDKPAVEPVVYTSIDAPRSTGPAPVETNLVTYSTISGTEQQVDVETRIQEPTYAN